MKLSIDSDALRRGFPYRVTPLCVSIFIAPVSRLMEIARMFPLSSLVPSVFCFIFSLFLSPSLSFFPSPHRIKNAVKNSRSRVTITFISRLWLFISLEWSRKNTPVQRRAPDVDSMRDIRRANNPRTNQRTHTRARACAHCNICNTAYNTYAHTTKQYKTRRYDTIRYETGRSSVSHSPSGSISQFLLPLFRVALIRRRWLPEQRLRGRKLSSFRNFTRSISFPHVRRQAGPRGTAPGRGPFALLHDTLSLMMALRRHLRASPHYPRYTTGATNWLRTSWRNALASADQWRRAPPSPLPTPRRSRRDLRSRNVLKSAQVRKGAWMKKHKQIS